MMMMMSLDFQVASCCELILKRRLPTLNKKLVCSCFGSLSPTCCDSALKWLVIKEASPLQALASREDDCLLLRGNCLIKTGGVAETVVISSTCDVQNRTPFEPDRVVKL